MKSSQLIEFFSRFTVLPVRLNDIADHITESGAQDEIRFIDVELDVEVLRGFLHRYIIRDGLYSEPIRRSDVYFDRRQGIDWQRIVCCKELLHMLDSDSVAAASRADVATLIERIVLPQEVRVDGLKVLDDKVGIAKAIAVLLPKDARDLLMPNYKSGDITDEDIAELAQIPLRFVHVVMLDAWEQCHRLLLDI